MIAPMQATRDVFPYEDDRAAARAFLRGKCAPPSPSLTISGARGLRFNNALVAWFDSQGSLIGQLPTGLDTPTAMRLLHFLLDELGITARIERNIAVPSVTGWTVHYFYDGSAITNVTDPITLCGPLVIQAYRTE